MTEAAFKAHKHLVHTYVIMCGYMHVHTCVCLRYTGSFSSSALRKLVIHSFFLVYTSRAMYAKEKYQAALSLHIYRAPQKLLLVDHEFPGRGLSLMNLCIPSV